MKRVQIKVVGKPKKKITEMVKEIFSDLNCTIELTTKDRWYSKERITISENISVHKLLICLDFGTLSYTIK